MSNLHFQKGQRQTTTEARTHKFAFGIYLRFDFTYTLSLTLLIGLGISFLGVIGTSLVTNLRVVKEFCLSPPLLLGLPPFGITFHSGDYTLHSQSVFE